MARQPVTPPAAVGVNRQGVKGVALADAARPGAAGAAPASPAPARPLGPARAARHHRTCARAGYPSVIVPFGTVPNNGPLAFPDGFDPKPAPLGVTFTGMACSEPRLIALAYAFEQATKKRIAPLFP